MPAELHAAFPAQQSGSDTTTISQDSAATALLQGVQFTRSDWACFSSHNNQVVLLVLLCRQWVAVRLEGADNLQESLARCLHADGSCGPRGFKQRVLLDLQCRGFAVQFR
jgi:hypothetical protein